MPTGTHTQPSTAYLRTALLWDLDNVSVQRDDMPSLAESLSSLVEPASPRIASANWRAYRLYRNIVRSHGIRVICGGHDPDGADGVLLRQVKRLRRRGIDRFLVASNDHSFAKIATFAELHVLTLTSDYVSGRLLAAATSAMVMEQKEDGWRLRSMLSNPAA